MKSIEIEVVALVERNGRLILQSAGMEQEKGYIQHGAVSCYLLPAFFFCGIYECLAGKAVSDSGTFAEFGAGSTAARLFSI